MFGPISCSTTFNRRSFVQMSFIALLKKHLFVRRKLRKCTKKNQKIPFIVICKYPKRFNRFRTTFELRSMIFFFIFLPTVFCHSFTLSFYSFKYESASTFSFFRQKLWKLPIILPSMKYDRNDYGYNGCTKFGKLVYQVVLVSAKNQLVAVWKKMNLELHYSQRSCRKNYKSISLVRTCTFCQRWFIKQFQTLNKRHESISNTGVIKEWDNVFWKYHK